MNKLGVMGLIVLGLITSSLSFADQIVIPLSIKQDKFVKEMKKRGMDLRRRDDSDGYVEYGPQGFMVVTYKPITFEQLDLIREVSFKCVRKDKK